MSDPSSVSHGATSGSAPPGPVLSESDLLGAVEASLATGTVHAVIFDWDGTFADSTEANFVSMRTAVEYAEVSLDPDWFRSHSGVSSREMVHMLIDGDEEMIDDIVRRRDECFTALSAEVRPFSDSLVVARMCRGRGIPIAVASGGSHSSIVKLLGCWGLSDLFPIVVGREDVESGKPSPDCFLLAAQLMRVPPSRCLVLEDSDQGLAAATHAGMPAIDVRVVAGRTR